MEGTLTLSRFVESLNITESFGLGLISPPVDLWWQGPSCGKDLGCGMGGGGGGERSGGTSGVGATSLKTG